MRFAMCRRSKLSLFHQAARHQLFGRQPSCFTAKEAHELVTAFQELRLSHRGYMAGVTPAVQADISRLLAHNLSSSVLDEYSPVHGQSSASAVDVTAHVMQLMAARARRNADTGAGAAGAADGAAADLSRFGQPGLLSDEAVPPTTAAGAGAGVGAGVPSSTKGHPQPLPRSNPFSGVNMSTSSAATQYDMAS